VLLFAQKVLFFLQKVGVTDPDVIIGMILVNDNNAIVLFDSGASHSFVAASFVQKHNLPLSMVKN
jgi:hypothetical protein